MKIDTSTIARNTRGAPFLDPELDERGRPLTTDGQPITVINGQPILQAGQEQALVEVTLGDLLFGLCETRRGADGKPDTDQLPQRKAAYRLRQKLAAADGYVDLTDDEVTFLRARLDIAEYQTDLWGFIYDALLGAEAAERPIPKLVEENP